MSSVPQIEEIIKKVLKERADELGVSSGFIKRVREFRGSTFVQAMVLRQMQQGETALSDLVSFAKHAQVNVSEQAIDQQFSSTTALSFEEVLNCAFTQVVAADPVTIALLKRFSEVIVEDSSTIGLPDTLLLLYDKPAIIIRLFET